jgi:methylthioribulose-1-phosphate dehydratase
MSRSIITSEKDARPIETIFARRLAKIGRNFYKRGWVLGTSGNFSALLSETPFRLLITSSGMDKGALTRHHFLKINEQGVTLDGDGKPSAETALHLSIVRLRQAKAVLHTHSVWGTLLSDAGLRQNGLVFEGYEMLKGLSGVTSHQHREWLPVIDNSQDYIALSQKLEQVLNEHADCHGVMLHQHGLYTWGNSIEEAKRHVEIFEFLLEVSGRKFYQSAIKQ